MKKLIPGILAMLMCFSLASCNLLPGKDSGGDNTNSESSSNENTSSLEQATEFLNSMYLEKDLEVRKDYEVVASVLGYSITWTVDVAEGVKVVAGSEGMVKIDVDENLAEDLTYVLTATVSDGAGNTNSVSFTRKVLKAPALTPEAITQAPVAGTAYKYHVYQSTLGKDLYFAGQMDGYYYMTTESYEEAVDVYAEYVEGSTTEFYLYFNHNVDGKQYFGVQLSTDGAHDNIVYTTTPVSTFVWNEKLETVTTHLEVNKQGNAADYYFGNYASHDTISASMISYAGGAGNNVGHLVEMIDKNDVPATKKIAAVKEALDVQLEHKMDKTIELTMLDERFADVAISWSVSETTAASIADNVLSLTIPAEQETVTLTATLTCGEDTDTKVFELVLGPKVVSPAADATAAEIVEAAFSLAKNEALEGTYTLTGVITKVNTAYSADYQNVTVTISVEDKAIECFRLKGEGADVIKAGDTITVTGSLKNYNGKVEFDSGCTLDSYVVGEGTPDDGGDVEPSLDAEGILTALYALADGESLTGPFTLTGKITALDSYNNPTIVVEGFENMPVYCYKLVVSNVIGDTITVTAASMKNYMGTYEFMNCTLVTENEGGEDSGEDSGEGEEGGDNEVTYAVVTISEANAAADGTNVQVSGTVSAINTAWNDSYGNICVTIEDENGDSLYLYRLATNVALGDIITVKGTMATYNNARQIAAGATAEITGHDASYDYVELTIAEALKAADNTNVIVTGTVVKIGTAYNSQYDNISVYIADDSGTQLYLYRLSGDVNVNDIIKVKGAMATYSGNRQLTGGTFENVGTHVCANYTEATCAKPAACIVCGVAKDDVLSTEHDYADATCTEPETCTVCGATNGNALGHTTDNGTCENCGNEIGGEVVAQYVKVASAADFTTGTYVLIVSDMNITLSTIDGTWVRGTSLSAGDSIDKAEGDALAITLEVSTDGVKIKIGDQYIKPKGGNTNGIATGDYTWAYEFQDDGTIIFKGVDSDTVYLAYNSASNALGFRGYKTSTVESQTTYSHTFTAYKLVG